MQAPLFIHQAGHLCDETGKASLNCATSRALGGPNFDLEAWHPTINDVSTLFEWSRNRAAEHVHKLTG